MNANQKIAPQYGGANTRLVEIDFEQQTILCDNNVQNDLIALLQKAKNDGVALSIISHWRSYEHQTNIWANKWSGNRTLMSQDSTPLDSDVLDDQAKFNAIAHWSALPGTSRHHWGTDFDVFMQAPIENGYRVQLTPEEFSENGPSFALESWLTENLELFGFYRPYQIFKGGVAVEPWHISYRKIANDYFKQISHKELQQVYQAFPFIGSSFASDQLINYLEQYVFSAD